VSEVGDVRSRTAVVREPAADRYLPSAGASWRVRQALVTWLMGRCTSSWAC